MAPLLGQGHVRQALGRAICRQHQTEQGDLPTINLAPSLEERLMQAVTSGMASAHQRPAASRYATGRSNRIA